MSRKNILKTEEVAPNKVHVTFDAADGKRKYEYVGSSARAILRGKTDPSLLIGKLVEHKKH
jgi:hypothetical protein